ncbi:MAG: hypothetical protein ACRDJM_02285 [Actinomycetota bacterium]
MRHILIVANQTACGEHLQAVVQQRIAQGPCRFTLVVPARIPEGHLTWTEGQGIALANQRLEEALPKLRAAGAPVEGVVGDRRPVLAVDDFLRHAEVDEIIVSTLPPGASKWLRQDLPRRIQRTFDVPVTHVIDTREPATIAAGN